MKVRGKLRIYDVAQFKNLLRANMKFFNLHLQDVIIHIGYVIGAIVLLIKLNSVHDSFKIKRNLIICFGVQLFFMIVYLVLTTWYRNINPEITVSELIALSARYDAYTFDSLIIIYIH